MTPRSSRQRSWRRALDPRGALHVRPGDAATAAALRAGAGVAGPLLVLLVVDRLDLSAYVSSGAFTALYARFEPYRTRGRILAVVGIGLVAAVAAGTVLAAAGAARGLTIVALAVVAAAATVGCVAIRSGPPAGLMPAFATAVCGEIPIRWTETPLAIGAAAAAALWCWAVCMAGALVRPQGPERLAVARALEAVAARVDGAGPADWRARHAAARAVQRAWHGLLVRRPPDPALAALLARGESILREANAGVTGDAAAARCRDVAARLRGGGAMPTVRPDTDESDELAGWLSEGSEPPPGSALRRPPAGRRGAVRAVLAGRHPAWPLGLRAGAAALVSGSVALAVGLGHSYWAPVSAIAVLQATNLASATHRAVQRAVGTTVGLVLAMALLLEDPRGGWAVLLIIACQVAAELVVARNYALGMVFVTPLALVVTTLGHPASTGTLVRERFLDTLVGAAIGLLMAVLVPYRAPTRDLVSQLERVRASTRELATALADPRISLEKISDARVELATATLALRDLQEVAEGEPWPQDLPLSDVNDAEREGHRLLGAAHHRLTRDA